MSNLTIEEDHAQAALGLLRANSDLIIGGSSIVYDGATTRPAPPPPYVVVYTRVAFPKDGTGVALDAAQSAVTTTVTCHCVGQTAIAARTVAMQVRATLLNARPVITGRNCAPFKQTASTDPNFDDSTGTTVFDAVQVYEFMSTG